MPTLNYASAPVANNYDPRWFIWTIVFLVVTGISLVSYIVLSDDGNNNAPDFTPTKTSVNKAASQK